MKIFKLMIGLFGLILTGQSYSAIFYVGDGVDCDSSSLTLALSAAALNGIGTSDEIRLTNTVDYIGAGEGVHVLDNWNTSVSGEITIVGGFANCSSTSSSGFTQIGGGMNSVFDIKGESVVTLRNLQVINSQTRGIIVSEGSVLSLESSEVSSNVAGVRVLGGSYVYVGEDSTVFENGDLDDIPKGGGIWCFGINSQVNIEGTISRNQAVSGGNMYIEDGCFAELGGGARIIGGRADGFEYSAHSGGGIWVDNGGELYANGGQDRVHITDHRAIFDGGGLYVHGTGKATLLNTFIARNVSERDGSGLFAKDGGNSVTQVIMDRAASCPFLISCSEFDSNEIFQSVVHVENSKVKIQRTLFDSNEYGSSQYNFNSLIQVRPSGVLQMSHSNMTNNKAHFLIESFGNSELSHITFVDNYTNGEFGGIEDSFVWYSTLGSLRIENSIFQDTQGSITSSSAPNISGKCNLIDNSTDWPGGSYTTGTATFNNVAGGDARQQSSSDGVDMCLEDTFAWSNDVDIEYQNAPVNENTNPQGMPGESGGLYDAGFDEVYDNIGNDEFLLTVQREGSGTGVVQSDPLGITCGTNCTEVFFNGTLVTLTATATGNSEFTGWGGCPLANGNQCSIAITESDTVFAEFQPDDLIFSDGFE